MAFLCHELRNPLHVLASNQQFLADTTLNDEQVGFTNIIANMVKVSRFALLRARGLKTLCLLTS
jgi:signal transduction histidine kinase